MSGRIYDQPGIPICQKCGGPCLTSEETNFNGPYCENCKISTGWANYNKLHPVWIDYTKWMEQFQGKLINFEETSLKNYKKINGISFKKI